jgi:hypothetical protein
MEIVSDTFKKYKKPDSLDKDILAKYVMIA